jgi:hypothetical protein
MVKNNGIPIEVKKPAETVYEIKNETPSFEEFMETYEADENVIDSYRDEVEYVNGWASKGSGPCRVCSQPTRSVAFKMACPAVYCDDKVPGYWSHVGCGDSRMQITNKGDISCDSCGASYNMANWNFACSRHRGDYRSIGQDSWDKCMSVALGMGRVNQVVRDLNIYVTNHPEKFGWN